MATTLAVVSSVVAMPTPTENVSNAITRERCASWLTIDWLVPTPSTERLVATPTGRVAACCAATHTRLTRSGGITTDTHERR